MINCPSHRGVARRFSRGLTRHCTLRTNFSFPLELGDRRVDDVNNVLIANIGNIQDLAALNTKSTGAILSQLMLPAHGRDCPGTTASNIFDKYLAVSYEGRITTALIDEG